MDTTVVHRSCNAPILVIMHCIYFLDFRLLIEKETSDAAIMCYKARLFEEYEDVFGCRSTDPQVYGFEV